MTTMLPAPAPVPATAEPLIFDTPDPSGEPPLHHILIRLSHDDGRTAYVEMPVESGSGNPYRYEYSYDILDGIAALSGQTIPALVFPIECDMLESALATEGTCRYPQFQVMAKVVTLDDLEAITLTVSGFGEQQSARLCIDPHTDLPDLPEFARDWPRDAVGARC